MIITIARQCGCEGDEVGRKLSEIYGIPCYSKKELIELAKEKKVYDKYPFYFGERQVDDMMSMVADDMNLKVRETPKKALSALFEDQPSIVIGRASDYAYKNIRMLYASSCVGTRKQESPKLQRNIRYPN